MEKPLTTKQNLGVRTYAGPECGPHFPRLEAYFRGGGQCPWSYHPAWLAVLCSGLGHKPYCLEAVEDGKTRGYLGLAYIRSLLFGRFLVSLPYLNYGGVRAGDQQTAGLLISEAKKLADQLGVRYLELRHEKAIEHPVLAQTRTDKVHMRLPLPSSSECLWKSLTAKVRNQVRKGQNSGLVVSWGRQELLSGFYTVFSHNMRDLGTPVYGQRLFRSILEQFPERTELCLVTAGTQPVAGALLLHGCEITEVPSA